MGANAEFVQQRVVGVKEDGVCLDAAIVDDLDVNLCRTKAS